MRGNKYDSTGGIDGSRPVSARIYRLQLCGLYESTSGIMRKIKIICI